MMQRKNSNYSRIAIVVLLGLTLPNHLRAQAGTASLHGQVTDPSGAIVRGATVQITSPNGQVQTTTTGADGVYRVRGLASGETNVAVTAGGFTPYMKDNVNLTAGQDLALNVSLELAAEQQQVTVSAQALTLDTNPENNASQVVITEKELDALPDDPDELQADLEALAGPGAGPNGGQMYIDGFTAGQLPPKSSIREIRINSNPFSAEYDQVGFGRIEILTKPGGGAWHGSVSLNSNDAIFNTRNPFAPTKGDFESNQFNGNVGGGLGKKASLFLNADYRRIDNSAVVNAVILDPAFNPETYQTLNPLPQYRLNVGPRLDWQLSKNNTLTVRYQYERNSVTNSGVGNLILPVQASNELQTEDQLQVTDTQYFGGRVVYETRFQYLHEPTNNIAANLIPAITVPGAFTGGGSGNVIDLQNHYELQSYTSIAFLNHFLKFGARIREATDSNTSTAAFFGAFQFPSLTAYQNMISGLASGLTMAQIIAQPGCNTGVPTISNGECGPNQYSVTAGNPYAYVSMIDAGPFIQDDWKVRSNLTLSYGLRFETQNHIRDHMDWAPRFGAAWGVGGTKTVPKYVVRAGWGMFYSRFAEANILQALRQNGITEQQYIVTDPAFYCGPTTATGTVLAAPCPSASTLAALGSSSVPTVYQISPDFHAPYMMQTSVSLERQLSKFMQLSLTYNNARGFDELLMANVNAPVLPGTEIPTPACVPPATLNCGIYPNGIPENIYRYESAGKFRQNQFFANLTIRPGTGKLTSKLTLNGYYVLNYADSTPNAAANNAGLGGFVMNPYNIFEDYGQAGGRFGTRNIAFFLGSVKLPYGMNFYPAMNVSSGAPYTITLGKDLLGTSVLNQRPGFISSATCPVTEITGSIYCTSVGTFDSTPSDGETLVPVNSLRGPAQFVFNLRLTKVFTLTGKPKESAAQGRPGGAPGGQGGFGAGGRGFGGGGRGGFAGGGGFGGGGRGNSGGGDTFTISINARNVFNRVNLAAPIGTLGSPLFGESESLSNPGPGGSVVANRQVYLQGTFSF